MTTKEIKKAQIRNAKESCKSFGKHTDTFKKCTECEEFAREACQEEFKSTLIAAKKEEAAKAKDPAPAAKPKKEEAKPKEPAQKATSKKSGPKIGKAQEVKNAIFSLAKKAEYTRRELGQVIRAKFPEYSPSTLSTYISDSFNPKYAGKTGCGKNRMLAYQKGKGGKKIITVA